MIRVVLIDDEDLVRQGLSLLINDSSTATVVGEAADGRAGLDVIARTRPDVVLVDLRMPYMDGVSMLRELNQTSGPSPAVVVLTAFDTDELIHDALSAGAVGFLVKTAQLDGLVDAIVAAHEGRSTLSPGVLGKLLVPQNTVADVLSPREREIAEFIAEGYSNPEIAARLYLTLSTVKTYIARAMDKLGVDRRAQLAGAVAHPRALPPNH